MKVIAFDLGDTLVEYAGFPLSWEAHYLEALENLALSLGLSPTEKQYRDACEVLRRVNTRIYPRTEEVSFENVLKAILKAMMLTTAVEELKCARAFFKIFRTELRCFPDSISTLSQLRKCGIKIGVFTDIPYGMPHRLVSEDVQSTGLTKYFDTLVTSGEAGHRKPSPKGLRYLANKLLCEADDMAYIGNEQKDVEAALSFGCKSILIDRDNRRPNWGQDRTITALSELQIG